MEYRGIILVIKGDKLTILRNLESILQRAKKSTAKDNILSDSTYITLINVHILEVENRLVVARVRDGGCRRWVWLEKSRVRGACLCDGKI